MYDGTYTADVSNFCSKNQVVNPDAQAWVLGDRLRSTGFKNYAMSRLYAQYTADTLPRSITTSDTQYAITHSPRNSKLRNFFEVLLATQFLDHNRVVGSSKEWDNLLQEHAYLRELLLSNLRTGAYKHWKMAAQNIYMDTEDVQSTKDLHTSTSNLVIPAKRGADGVPLKKEITEH
jgi:hypothetical protein